MTEMMICASLAAPASPAVHNKLSYIHLNIFVTPQALIKNQNWDQITAEPMAGSICVLYKVQGLALDRYSTSRE